MMELLELFVLKMVDTMIGAGKTIFMIKGMKLQSALSQAISNVFYVILMSKLMKNTDFSSVFITSLAMFFGQLLSQTIAERFNRDKVYKVSATAKTLALGETVIERLREAELNFRVLEAQGKHSKALALDIFCPSKEETKIARQILDDYNVKHYMIELKAITE